ncbi:MAG: hypothetical protein QXN77_07840 [Candidatus Caldarchaeum sp.]
MPEEVNREKVQFKTLLTISRPNGKALQLLKTQDGRILISARQGDSRMFFQLEKGEAAVLGLKLVGEVMKD